MKSLIQIKQINMIQRNLKFMWIIKFSLGVPTLRKLIHKLFRQEKIKNKIAFINSLVQEMKELQIMNYLCLAYFLKLIMLGFLFLKLMDQTKKFINKRYKFQLF